MDWPSFSPPPKKQRLHVYSWQGKVGCVFHRLLTICTTVFPHPITFWTRLVFNLVRVGKEWAGPVFPHPLTSNFMFYAYSGQGNLRLAEFFPTSLTICTKVFPHHPVTFWTRLIFNLVRVGKEWASPAFPHPLTSNFMFYAYSWQGKIGWVFPHPIHHMHNSFPHLITFCLRLMFNLVRLGKERVGPVFPHPLKSKGYMCIHDRVRLAVLFSRRFTLCTTVFPHPITF